MDRKAADQHFLCSGRQASAANTALLLTKEFGIFHKLLSSPPDVLGICQSFPVSLLKPQRGQIKPAGKTLSLTLQTPQKCFKKEKVVLGSCIFMHSQVLPLINQKLQLPRMTQGRPKIFWALND